MLAQQQAQQNGQPPAMLDPVQALAMGHPVAQQAPPPPLPAQKGSGALDSFVRQAANAATFNLADPIAAVADATFSIDPGSSKAKSWSQRLGENLKNQRALTSANQQESPYASLGGSVVGGFANPATRALPAAQGLGDAILQGAGIGGAYGAGASIGAPGGLSDAAKNIGMGVASGGAFGAGGYGLGKILSGATRTPAAQLLANEGVPLTPGESLGGVSQTLEDATTHIPMMGNAIKSRQMDAVMGFNRATYNRVLEPLGIQYAKDGPIGNEGVDKISSLIGDAYDKAYDGATVLKSQGFMDKVDSAADEASNLLPKEKVNQVYANINRLVTSKFDQDGVMSPEDLKLAKNWFAEQSRAGPTASLEDRAIAGAYGNVKDALKAAVAETDSGRGALLNAADSAYMRFLRVQQAAGTQNASTKGGIFTAGQLGNALRGMDNSVNRGSFAKGMAPMQDLAQAGSQVLPSTVPDSGTALRGLIELGAGGAAAHMLEPSAVLPAAGAIGAGTALYSKPGQTLANALLFGAPGARKAIGQIPPSMIPGLLSALSQNNSNGQP